MENEYHFNDFLERIAATENAMLKESIFIKFKIKPTAYYKYSSRLDAALKINYKEFKAHSNTATGIVCFICVVLFFFIEYNFRNPNFTTAYFLYSFIFIIASIIFCNFISHIFNIKNKNKSIILNAKGIYFEGTFYNWQNICTTAILFMDDDDEAETSFLILGYKDFVGYEKLNLFKYRQALYNGNTSELTQHIEYFKKKHKIMAT